MREIWISNLTQYTANAVSDRTEAITKPFTDSLINSVFVPFGEFTKQFDQLLDANDLGSYLTNNWQEIIFQQQAALAAAIIIALIYIVLVPTAGFFVACSECCCIARCQKTARCCSCCGIFNRIMAGISAICVIIGGCLVLVANSHTDQAIASLPDEFQTTVAIPSAYLENVKGQLDVYFDDYKSFTVVNLDKLTDEQIGENTKKIVKDAFADTNSSITGLITEVDNSITLVTDLVDDFAVVSGDAQTLAGEISDFRANGCDCANAANVAACTAACNQLSFDTTSFDSVKNEIDQISQEIKNVDLDTITTEIDDAINQERFNTNTSNFSTKLYLKSAVVKTSPRYLSK